jgi:internalin A
MANDVPQGLNPEDLDAVLERAKAERWTELALLGPDYQHRREWLIRRDWPAPWVFLLAKRLEQVSPALLAIDSLTSLDLTGNQIGEEGAEAIAGFTDFSSLDLGDMGIARGDNISSLTALTSLDLANNSIGDAGAEAIGSLAGLTALDLADNQIGDAGAEAIGSLAGLTALNLANNKIGDAGAEAIGSLAGLTALDLADNQIDDKGVSAIVSLTELVSLNLSGNRLGDRGCQAIAWRLSKLTTLALGRNRVGYAGVLAISRHSGLTSLDLVDNRIFDSGAAAIARLPGLTSLDLARNRIGEAGARVILDAWADPSTAGRRRHLDLRDNGDLGGLLPEEVLGQTDAQALIAAWRRFREAGAMGKLRPLNEAKVLVVGKGNVGKTSLIRYLTTGRPRDPTEPATEGVRAYEKIATERWSADGSPFSLNIWDFGGQEIYYGTHRYFLTARSLYLLVLDDRTDGPADAEKWLQRVRSHAAGAPVIVVVNKAGEGGPGLRLDEAGLEEHHGPIVAFHRSSCDPGNDARIDALKALILGVISDSALMPEVHRGYPDEWWRIKDALAEQARARQYVQDHEFRSLCAAHGLVEDSDQRAILATLDNLGTVVAHGLDPEARAAHRETTLLDPNWLTQAIYAILGSARVRDQNGEFAPADLGAILDPTVYPQRFHEKIVTLMQDARLGLCLRLPDQQERYLLPAALPPSVPGALAAGVFRPCRRYRYSSLPGDLLPRFMVQVRGLIGEGSARWRDGVVLTLHGCHALVRAMPAERRVDIGLDASTEHADPRRAIEAIEDEFGKLHREFGAIEAKAFVPLPDRVDEVDIAVLRRLARENVHNYRHESADGARDYKVRELLSGVREADEVEPVELSTAARILAWLETWPGTAFAAAVIVALAASVVVPLPWSEWDQKLGWGLVLAVVTYLVVRRSDPQLIYRRLLWITVPASLAMLLLGGSVQFGIWAPGAFIEGRVGAGSIWVGASAFVIVAAILATADVHLQKLRKSIS